MTHDAASVPTACADVIGVLRASRRLVLTTHVGSDGDGIGCELALGRTLRASYGSDVAIINPTPTQERYAFLFEPGEVRGYAPELDATIAAADCVVVLDINRWDRLGDMAEPVRRSGARKLCIDHHPAPEHFGDVSLIDPAASATGVLVHDLVMAMRGKLSEDVIDPLYVAIMTDTGSFRFANTNPRAFEIATELVRRGAKPDVLFRRIYETSSPGRMRLLGHVLSTLELECEGQLVHFTITGDTLQRCGVERDEAEGFTDVVRSMDGSIAVISFMETEHGGAKVSLRSKGSELDVGRIALSLGGGGHANASGIVDARPLEVVKREVLGEVRGKLDGCG